MAELIEMQFVLFDSGGLMELCIRRGLDPPMRRGNFEGEKGRPVVKYRDTLP